MTAEGMVSLWVGNASSPEALEQYVAHAYTDDGDEVPSAFARDFALGTYDPGKREAEVIDSAASNLSRLLAGVSYDQVVVPRFVQVLGDTLQAPANALVLLYDVAYDGGPKPSSVVDVHLYPLGAVRYR